MSIFLYVVPILTIIAGLFVYRHNGKKEVFRIDSVQFFYTFLLAPVFFVWMKSFIFFLLRSDTQLQLGPGQLFIIDTALTLMMLYVYAFVVIHSLTKSFRLKSEQDPLYDLFTHSEYFHLWLSHIVIALGSMTLFTIVSIFNAVFPLAWNLSQPLFFLICFLGIFTGSAAFLGLTLTDPKQEGRRYMRLMKIAIGLFFLFHMILYFAFDPPFSSEYGMYWFNLFSFSTMFIWALFTYKSSKINRWFIRLRDKNKDTAFWGMNEQLFKRK
jgi:hypothetical protein